MQIYLETKVHYFLYIQTHFIHVFYIHIYIDKHKILNVTPSLHQNTYIFTYTHKQIHIPVQLYKNKKTSFYFSLSIDTTHTVVQTQHIHTFTYTLIYIQTHIILYCRIRLNIQTYFRHILRHHFKILFKTYLKSASLVFL